MLKIKRHNQYLALRVIDRVSSYRPRLVGSTPALFKREGPTIVAIPVFCILFAILNLGGLAIAETIVATSANLEQFKPLRQYSLRFALVQLRSHSLCRAFCMRALAQSSWPGWRAGIHDSADAASLASIPFGMWALKQLQPAAGQGGAATPPQRVGWGLTTVFFKANRSTRSCHR